MNAFNRNTSQSKFQPRMQRSLVATACVLALSGLAGTGAVAQVTQSVYSLTFGAPSLPSLQMDNYADWFSLSQYNSETGIPVGSVASINGATLGVDLTGVGGELATPVTVTNNFFKAIGGGNRNTATESLSLIRKTVTTDGIGMLTSQVQGSAIAPMALTATVTNAEIRIRETNLPPATLVLSNNTISAATQLNRSDSAVEGLLPISGYTSAPAQNGNISATSNIAGLGSTSNGSVNIVTQQTALNASALAGSGATVSNGDVTLNLAETTGGVLSAPLTVSGNSMAADFGANQATSIFNALAAASNFTGSVAVTNAQANIEIAGGATPATATVELSAVTANVRNQAAVATELTAPLVVSGNAITARSSGNVAGERTASGSILAGNAIVFGSGNDVTGSASGSSSNVSVGAGPVTASLQADLALLSGQANYSTALVSRVTDGNVTISADDMGVGVSTIGSITANRNTVAASSVGNLAGNLITADAVSFNATAAAANQQINSGTAVEAGNSDAAVTVGIGLANVIVGGPITASENTLSARAEGSVAATNVSLAAVNFTALRGTGASSTVGADRVGLAFGTTSSLTGVSANNLQGNYDSAAGGIVAGLSGTVAVNVTEDGSFGGTVVPISGAAITLENNVLSGLAMGNKASTGVSLSGTNASVQAAVGNTQFHDGGTISSSVNDSGVTALSGGVTDSAVTVNKNTVASSATANDGTNNLSASFANLTAGQGGYFAAVPNVGTSATLATSNAALGIASNQINLSSITAINSNPPGAFAAIIAGGAAGVDNSNLTVNGNAATVSSTGNRVANTLAVDSSNLATGVGGAAPVAGIANLQVNDMPGLASASVDGRIGIDFYTSATDSRLTVNDNKVTATTLGNTAASSLTVSGVTNFAPAASGFTTGSTALGLTTNAVTSDFAVANSQLDAAAGGRSANAGDVIIGIGTFDADVSGSNLSVQRNQVTAEARNNDASNSLAFANGLATLGTSAAVSNLQRSSAAVAATVGTYIAVSVPVAAATTTIDASNLTATDNRALGLAVGNSASNSLNAAATNLSGNANIAAGTGGSNWTAPALTTNADYGVSNFQTHSGQTDSTVGATVAIDADGAPITGGAASVTGNSAQAIAQSNSASSAAILSGTNITGVTGAVASVQDSSGTGVTAIANTAAGGASFAVRALSIDGTPVTVSGNAMLASAGRNEAFNTLSASATTLSGGGKGNNASAYVVASGVVTTGADYSVMNVQQASGNVNATANPGLIGVVVGDPAGVATGGLTGASVTVSGNDVTAKANVNYANNALNLSAQSTLAATGAVNNVQDVTSGVVTATLGATTVGIAPPVPAVGSVLNNTLASVSNNALTAQAGGNTSVNALNATAGGTISNGGVSGSGVTSNAIGATVSSTYAVLNQQSNNATMLATATSGVAVGVIYGGAAGNNLVGIQDTNVTVLSNQLLASAYGNTASNSIALSALATGANQASAGISNVQYNMASISATVASVSMGVNNGTANGGSIVVSGNGTTAQAMGNVAVNRITSR